MKDKFVSSVGIWRQRHYNYLKNPPTVIIVMRMKGTFEQYQTDLDRDAQKMFNMLMKQYAEQLKAENQLDWVSRINSIRNRAAEVVSKVLIYS